MEGHAEAIPGNCETGQEGRAVAKSNRPSVLTAVRNPLIFFSLALLVIEGIIGLVVAKSQMTGGYQFASVCIMAMLFLFVVGIVAYITIRWPRHLYEQIAKELETSRRIEEFINSAAFRDAIEDVLMARVKPESLREQEVQGGSQ